MLSYIIKKIIAGIFVLLGVVILVFLLFQLVRFNPAYASAGEQANEQTIQNISKELGLDKSMGMQLRIYLNNISPLSIYNTTDQASSFFLDDKKYNYKKIISFSDKAFVIKAPYLGRSFQTNRSVVNLMSERIPNTLVLACTAILFATVIGIILGVIASIKPNSLTDSICTAGSVLGISLPSFFAAIVLQLIFAYMLAAITGFNLTGDLIVADEYTGENYLSIKNLILPAIALGIRPIAVITQITRSSMLDILHADFVRTAYAKGLSQRIVLFKHALRNALIPVITSVTGWFASLLAGAFFIEVVFQYNGIGLETINAIKTKDIPVAMGAMLFTAGIFVVISVLTDILYSIADPRVKVKSN
ncbi:MAG: ABC transporter permease [Fimbriimonadaceae bacterium]|nr:ABC transporter permease [Chitinophagales bacterium]